MQFEAVNLGEGPVDGGVDGRQTSGNGDDGGKASRLPRWTRQEILVLIQGKRVAESRVRRGPGSRSALGPSHVEPKWASVSSYCKRHGVNRGPVQCRKRWSNLAGDFKKIKEWESKIKMETESFWVMRNDLRRERKLPGFFDREVYDILDGSKGVAAADGEEHLDTEPLEDVNSESRDEAGPETLFDSGRSAAADDGLFSDFEEAGRSSGKRKETADEIPAPTPISVAEKRYQPDPQDPSGQGTHTEKESRAQAEAEAGESGEGRKRKRHEVDVERKRYEADVERGASSNIEQQLVAALEKNGKILSSQLEAQNTHLQLDREQRNQHVNSLLTVLNKLADALGRIADKL